MFTLRRVKARLVACAAVAAFSLMLPARASAQSGRPTESAPPLRSVTVTVTDKKGGLLTGLGRELFTILDDGRPSEIVSFAVGDLPLTVGVLLDASGSMLGDSGSKKRTKVMHVRNGLLRFFRSSHAENEFFLLAFNQSPQLLLGRSNDPAAVLDAIDRYADSEPRGLTAVYDTLYLALNQAARGRHARRAVVLITDGQDNMSRYKFNELKRALKESDVMVYAVGIVNPHDDSALGYGGRAVLEELAGSSGGRAFFPATQAEINETFERLALELRSQYIIGFAPAAATKKDGWHKVRVKLGEIRDDRGRKVNVFARTREGFYDVPPARRD